MGAVPKLVIPPSPTVGRIKDLLFFCVLFYFIAVVVHLRGFTSFLTDLFFEDYFSLIILQTAAQELSKNTTLAQSLICLKLFTGTS